MSDMDDLRESLREGRCPAHGTPLDRHGDLYWCDDCQWGWALHEVPS